MNKDKLHKFALNKLTSSTEIKEVLDWIESSEENKKEFETLKNLLAISSFANYDSYVKKKIKEPYKKVKLITLVMKYAAIFIFAFLVGSASFYYFYSPGTEKLAWNEIIVPEGESAEIFLSDSTHVWLNSRTTFTYPSKFGEEERNVKLTGEAYFDVTHNAAKPFNVETQNLTVAVKGTSFNVQAYNHENLVSVTLVKGKVVLKNPKGKTITDLSPGENASLDIQEKNISIKKTDTEFYTSWKDGYLVFRNESLENIVKKFERWYNVSVVFDDQEIKNTKFTGTILKNKSIDQIFNILKYTAKIDFSIERKDDKPSIIHLKKKPM